MTIRWNLSRQSLAAGPRDDGRDLELRWRLDALAGNADAQLMDGEVPDRSRAIVKGATLVHTCDGELLHVEARDRNDGALLLAATLRPEAAGAHVLYARTTLLAKLGVRGGRYEVLSSASEDGESSTAV
jgi:hypothetical protein